MYLIAPVFWNAGKKSDSKPVTKLTKVYPGGVPGIINTALCLMGGQADNVLSYLSQHPGPNSSLQYPMDSVPRNFPKILNLRRNPLELERATTGGAARQISAEKLLPAQTTTGEGGRAQELKEYRQLVDDLGVYCITLAEFSKRGFLRMRTLEAVELPSTAQDDIQFDLGRITSSNMAE